MLVAGRYRLGALLGTGRSGQVRIGRDEHVVREVAVKEVPRILAPYPGASAREAGALTRIRHQGVVELVDFVPDPVTGRDWLVLELVAGRTLGADPPLTEREALDVGGQVLAALRAVHELGLVHGDVKPANVLRGPDGRVVLVDFGLTSAPRRTGSPGVVAGSYPYLAPEIIRDGVYSPESDLYALGMTLYAAVTGSHHYDGPPPVLRPIIEGLLRPCPQQRREAGAMLG
ncbi:hypothetical protein GCM10010435_42810 [Winogradskya consettensis]|uniref:non-specific serine/threonine protein kinase n=2 Tax=Winogradskya consettensis TaxID=113560 RepID=A0A919VW40_9ACTN|nr:hypothetical protein Aco04nite_57960 [Actinoplanes consettensis]